MGKKAKKAQKRPEKAQFVLKKKNQKNSGKKLQKKHKRIRKKA